MHPEEIKAALRMKGVTLAALADNLGINRSTVCLVVAGKGTSARVHEAVAKLLGKPVSSIWKPKPQSGLRRSKATASKSATQAAA
jgi:lambda repressor-like predicted transcriptional regulator